MNTCLFDGFLGHHSPTTRLMTNYSLPFQQLLLSQRRQTIFNKIILHMYYSRSCNCSRARCLKLCFGSYLLFSNKKSDDMRCWLVFGP